MTPEEIRARRLEFGMTQDELARAVGVRLDTISKIESGSRNFKRMRADNFLSLARALKVTPEELMGDAPEQEKHK